ncbi:MAG: TonB-dependent siderophore receptor [Stenomitos rutilans HA7619-LM2]|nr:TonB-dependent siderophore receptor [Stenomitos rutilans HA7619-LM2]
MKSFSLIHSLCLVSTASLLFIPVVQANEMAPERSPTSTNLRNLKQPAKTVKEWLAQSENTPSTASVQVTGVKLERADTGLDITLETADSKPLQVDATKFRAEGKSLIADIPNAVLVLPNAQEFSAENPTSEVATVRITQMDAATIRVSVVGTTALPKSDVTLKVAGLAYSLNPEGETPEEELVVTGEGQSGYRVPDSTTATKTDTPLRDIPQSIQIIPRQLLDDRQITRIDQVADNVPGVQPFDTYGGIPTASFIIRGFNSASTVYRDGFREFSFANPINFAGVEQIEFLKGPASVLYGQNEPGGLVNVVSKQPLKQPYYSPSLTIGSFDFYQGALDLSGPLNAQKTAAYRLNLAYENAGSFRDFVDSKSIFVAPALSFQLGPKTKLTLNFEYQNYKFIFDRGLLPEPESFRVPISRFLGEPNEDDTTANYWRASYVLEHQFNQNWKFRSGFAVAIATLDEFTIAPGSLQEDRRTVNRGVSTADEKQQNFTLQNELIGKFKTGSIDHQVLLGIELLRYRFQYQFFGATIAPIDLFNPIYGARPESSFVDEFGPDEYGTDAISLYFQDQATFSKQWKLLAGGRLDLARSTDRGGFDNALLKDVTDLAFSPRVGLVYQLTDWLSLYANYATAFNPVIFGTSRTGASFDPERGKQFEAGIKADVIPNRLSATFAAYEITKKNVLITDPEDDRFSIQTGEQKSRGIEFNLVGRPVNGWNTVLSYALTDAFVSQDTTIPVGDKLAGAPKHQFGLWNSYEIQAGPLRGFGGGLGLYYVSKADAVLPNTDVDLPSYFRVDASIFYKRDKWKVQLNVNNLTNVESYKTRGFLITPQPPLTVLGTVSYTF